MWALDEAAHRITGEWSVREDSLAGIIALSDDGTLVGFAVNAESNSEVLGWWSMTEQRELASWDSWSDSGMWTDTIVRGSRVILLSDQTELAIPMAAADWFAALCRIQNRPYTPAETKALPGGVPSGAPCGG